MILQKNDALKLAHETFLKLKNMRTTHAEEAVTKLTELAAERQTGVYISTTSYKCDAHMYVDSIIRDNTKLQS